MIQFVTHLIGLSHLEVFCKALKYYLVQVNTFLNSLENPTPHLRTQHIHKPPFMSLCNDVFSITDPCQSVKCKGYKVCARKSFQTHECVCPSCSTRYSLVCGSDVKTYASECHMRKHACRTQKVINVKKDGPCGKHS